MTLAAQPHGLTGRIKPTDEQKAKIPRLARFVTAPIDTSGAPDDADNVTGAAINMGGNDAVGDCTVAGMGNWFAVNAKMLGLAITIVAAKLVAFYYSMTGGQDTGLVEVDVLQKMVTDGIDVGDGVVRKNAIWVAVDMKDTALVKFLIWKFWAIYMGVSLSNNDLRASDWNLPTGTDADDLPNPNNGHCIICAKYQQPSDPTQPLLMWFTTWGFNQAGNKPWADSRCDEGYIMIDEERASELNLDWNALLAEAQAAAAAQ